MTVQFINYHRTAIAPEPGDVYTLSSDAFLRQIELIKISGVPVVRAANAFAASKKYQLGITFDDGYKSDLINAEILARKGISAFFFISTAKIGEPGYLSADDIRYLEEAGMVVGSHSHDHIRLNSLPLSETRRQLSLSMLHLTEVLTHPVHCIAFPGGAYTGAVVDAAVEVGFKYCLTTEWGVNDFTRSGNFLAVKRNNILSGMSDDEFLQTITLRNRYKRMAVYSAKQAMRAVFPNSIYNRVRDWVNVDSNR